MLNLSPGPTHIPDFVLRAMERAPMHHKSAETSEVLSDVFATLQRVYATQNPVLVYTGSGTLAGEIAIQHLAQVCKRVLTVDSGRFGNRWSTLCAMYGLDVTTVTSEWGTQADVERIAEAASIHKPDAFVVVHSETSTGTFQDVEAMCAAVRRHAPDCFMVVDAITSVLVHELQMDSWGLDIVMGSSQKGFGAPPGLCFLGVSEKFSSQISPRFGMYGNIPAAIEQWQSSQVAYTPALHVLKAMQAACRYVEDRSIAFFCQRSSFLQFKVSEIVAACNLSMFSASPANGVTAISVPTGQAPHIKSSLESSGILVGGGQDHLGPDVIRVGHMGFCEPRHIADLIPPLHGICAEIGLAVDSEKLMHIQQSLVQSEFNDRSI